MNEPCIMAIDQGTTGTTIIVFSQDGRPIARSYREIPQYYPQPGWVEHDPAEIWQSVYHCIQDVLTTSGISPGSIRAIGITNQRETTLIWDRHTGKPIHRAIVWQCRRTTDLCQQMKKEGLAPEIASRTGLVIDAYFSGTKIRWLLDHVPGAMEAAEKGDLLFGTVDSWLIWQLTGGRVHATDFSNASRTMLFNLKGFWDPAILEHFAIPQSMLPEVRDSVGLFGSTVSTGSLPGGIPISGAAGDQQAALFGQACVTPGMVKNTYGTGCFILMNTGSQPVFSRNGLVTTIAWGYNGEITYALEGSVFIAGAAIQWLRDGLRMLSHASESQTIALSVPDTGGVYLVPAFVGLGAPHWDMNARGALTGLTRGTDLRHIVRASLEAIAYQTRDVVDAMVADSGVALRTLRVDGGASANNFLMQFQADLLGVRVERPALVETTAFGAACLAGLGSGLFGKMGDIADNWKCDTVFEPVMSGEEREHLYRGWCDAVDRVRSRDREET